MALSSATAQELRADRYHLGVRLAALGAWLAAIVIVYAAGWWLLRLILGEAVGVAVVLLFVVALFLSQPLARWGEYQLIRFWPSGRAVQLEPEAIVLKEKSSTARINLAQKVNFWRWRFEIRNRRGGHVPNGHHCLAIRLVQSDTTFSLYALVSPAQAASLMERYPFYQLHSPSEKGRSAALGGRDAIYLAAENARWADGAELDPPDFEALLHHLETHVLDFTVASAS